MSYSNTPNTGDTLGSTKVPVNTNFSLIQLAMSQDHNGMGTGTGIAGTHNVIHLVEQSVEGQTTATQTAIYTKQATTGDIFLRSPNHVDALPLGEYQLTTFSDANIPTFGKDSAYGAPPAGFTQQGGWTFLPGGLIFQYGFYGKALTTGLNANVQFPRSFANVFNISLTLSKSLADTFIVVNSVTFPNLTTFDVILSKNNADGFFWSAIGN